MQRVLVLFAVITSLVTSSAFAQDQSTIKLQLPPGCDGDYAIVRVSQIAPGGSMDGFLKAVEAHKAWYRAHGVTTNEIYTAKILVQDPTTKAWKYADNEIMVFHLRPPSEIKVDADWNAFVKHYKDNSNIKTEYITCMPKNH